MPPRILPYPISRRQFLEGAAASALIVGCGSSGGGTGPTVEVPATYSGYAGLADLPWFELQDGRLVAVEPDWPGAIDFHAHLGFGVGPESIDYQAITDRVQYLIDCDMPPMACDLDLDVYINRIASEQMVEDVTSELVVGATSAMGKIVTHTAPNLLRELDDMGFDKAVLLPIALGLTLPDDMTERFRLAAQQSEAPERLVSFCSVLPSLDDAVARLQAFKEEGYVGLKFHPTQQLTRPNDPDAMALFEECGRLDMPVFMHAGRAGIEPAFQIDFARMERYLVPIQTFPQTRFIFGHSGARDFEEALPIAKEYDNVWMGLHGQPVDNIDTMIGELDTERLLFGSDWPWYPLAASLVKVLHATQGNRKVRDRILSTNARRLLGIT